MFRLNRPGSVRARDRAGSPGRPNQPVEFAGNRAGWDGQFSDRADGKLARLNGREPGRELDTPACKPDRHNGPKSGPVERDPSGLGSDRASGRDSVWAGIR